MLMPRFSGGTARPSAATISPPIRIVPAEEPSRPAMQRSVVVLPQPLGPSSETNSPSSTVKERSRTAVTLP